MRKVKFAIIGAGTAGLNALGYIRRQTDDFVMIHGGPYGTTCARVGCMPSKALIHAANHYEQRLHLDICGIHGGDKLEVDGAKVMKFVRQLRDRFSGGVHANTTATLKEGQLIEGYAEFVGPNQLKVGDEIVEAERIIIGTGSTPVVPGPWKALGDKLLTSDEIFELETLPKRLAVIGLGVIGLELGQAFARLGVEVTAVEMLNTMAGLSSPELIAEAEKLMSKEMKVYLGQAADLSLNPDNEDEVLLKVGDEEIAVDLVLGSLGRRPNVAGLNLPAAGIELNERGMPSFDLETMQIEDKPIFIAGDVNAFRPILHEAGDEGRASVLNAFAYPEVKAYPRKAMLGVAFSEPQVGLIGMSYAQAEKQGAVSVTFMLERSNGRAIVMGQDKGGLSLYADPDTYELLGAELLMADAEHLGHMLAWAIQDKQTVFDLLMKPFYHPVLEEALQDALRQLAHKLQPERTNWVEVELRQ
ncbi:dihydrolipoyl dehydrogenase [Thiomicrorhabdus sp.]|uniref:dihydrolipoyl dehydrogenase n=1 Tax=Thiomicrorhabdus sp. TaxID=2039724 RepID=UPI0029C61460|nr:dihydrolipoyl dehydrogenase [Thiomicrorhabdus sp.]